MPSVKARLPEQRRVLVARQRRHGDGPAQNLRAQVADHVRGIHHLRQKRPGDVEHLQQIVIPLLGVDVEKHGAGSVGGVGHVRAALHQVPRKEAVHRAEAKLPAPGALVHVQGVQQILQLRAAEIRVRHQPGFLADGFGLPSGHQALHIRRGAAALPADGVVQAFPRLFVPQKRGFALVGDADGGDIGHVHAGQAHRRLQRLHLPG